MLGLSEDTAADSTGTVFQYDLFLGTQYDLFLGTRRSVRWRRWPRRESVV